MAKKLRHGAVYWTVFTACAIGAFGAGFYYTYQATSAVTIKSPNTTEGTAFQGGVLPEVTPEPVAVTPTPASSDDDFGVDPFGGSSTDPTTAPTTERKSAVAPTATPYMVVYTPSPAPTARPVKGPTLFRVHVGSYDTREAAQSMAEELLSAGITASVVYDQGQYHAQIGAYTDRDRALSVADDLNSQGYSVTIRH